MTRAISALCVLLLYVALCRSAEVVPLIPGPVEISQGVSRGKSLRDHKTLVPEALVKTGVLLKAGGVRYGHAIIKIEDAKGEGGAVYKLFETIKTCMPKGPDQEIMEYTGTFLLDPDLAMRGGTQVTTSTMLFERLSDKAKGKEAVKDPAKPGEKDTVTVTEKETVTATITVKDDKVIWVRHEKRGDDPETISDGDPIKLHGVRPVPRNALIAMAGFAASEPGFKPGISSPFCAPSLDMKGLIDEFMIQPAWLETDLVHDKKYPTARFVLRIRFLDGELGEKGLTVEPPTPEQWPDVLAWTFSDTLQILSPPPPELYFETEAVDPINMDINAPFDIPKIRAAVKVISDKMAKENDRTSIDDELRALKEKMKKEQKK